MGFWNLVTFCSPELLLTIFANSKKLLAHPVSAERRSGGHSLDACQRVFCLKVCIWAKESGVKKRIISSPFLCFLNKCLPWQDSHPYHSGWRSSWETESLSWRITSWAHTVLTVPLSFEITKTEKVFSRSTWHNFLSKISNDQTPEENSSVPLWAMLHLWSSAVRWRLANRLVLVQQKCEPPLQTLVELSESLELLETLQGDLAEVGAQNPLIHEQIAILGRNEVPLEERLSASHWLMQRYNAEKAPRLQVV